VRGFSSDSWAFLSYFYYKHIPAAVNVHVHAVMLNKFNSAYQKTDEIASQSNQVHVWNNGSCLWQPLFPWSVSHCSIDSTWFPFDEQRCSLFYASWNYWAKKMNLTTCFFGRIDHSKVLMGPDFSPNGIWEILGKSVVSILYICPSK